MQVDHPDIVHRVQQFYSSLSALQNVLCRTCLEYFPTINTNHPANEVEMCDHCSNQSTELKLYSAANDMDPGVVPAELCVHWICLKCLTKI